MGHATDPGPVYCGGAVIHSSGFTLEESLEDCGVSLAPEYPESTGECSDG